MGQDRADVEAGFEEAGQAIPGAEEPATGNAMDTDTFKNDFIGKIAGDGSAGNTEQGDTAAVFHGAKGVVQRGGVPRHFQRCVDPFAAGDLQNRRSNGIRSVGVCVQHVVDSYLLRQSKAIVTDIGGDNCRGSGRAGDGGGEEAGRAAPGDQDCVAGEILHECRIDRIAQRFLQAGQFRRNVRRCLPEDGLRQDDLVGKRSIQINAEDAIVLTHMGLAGTALKAGATGQVRFGCDIVAGFHQTDIRSNRDHLATHFMTDDAWRMDPTVGPGVPIVDVSISSAERRRFDPDHGVVGAGHWVLAFGVRQARLGSRFDECTHGPIITRWREMPSQRVKQAFDAAQ